MNRYFILLFVALAMSFSEMTFADVDISLQPTPVIAGEPAVLTIRSTEGRPEIESFPEVENMKWVSDGREENSVMIINGMRFEISNYQIVAGKTGTITLPALKIKAGDKSFETQPKDVAVVSGPLSDLEKYVFLHPVYGTEANTVYAGQEIPLEIYFYRASQFSANPIEYPQVKLDNVMFGNFRDINKESDRFAPYPYFQPVREEKEGVDYLKSCFFTTVVPISAGKLSGTVSVMLDVVSPRKRGRSAGIDGGLFNMSFAFGEDPFFSGNKRFTKLITAKLPDLNVLPLPPVPDTANFIGLFGKWDVKFDISSINKIKEGESLTVTVNIEGYGSLESLKAPALSISDFTVYPPEIKKYDMGKAGNQQKSKAVITYVLIPTKQGKNNISITLAAFDNVSGKYTLFPFNAAVDVQKNNLASGNSYFAEKVAEKSSENIIKKESKQRLNDSILYIKKDTSLKVLIPLWKNDLILIFTFVFAGPLLLLVFEGIRLRRYRINMNDSSRRRYKAEKDKRAVLKKLKNTKPEELLDFVNRDIVRLINDLSGYPPGTTVHELEKLIKDKELAECLKTANSMNYMPGSANTENDLKKHLYKAMKKFSMIAILLSSVFAGFGIFGASTSSTIDSFVTEYNKGSFKKAGEICTERIEKMSPNPAWLYNLGDCYYREGNMAKAMVCFQRALLLAPRDSDILQNLNHVRGKLFLPELYTAGTPVELIVYLRDIFRPDEWLLICSIAVFFIFIALVLRHVTHGVVWISILSGAIIMVAVSLTASMYQNNTLYSGADAIIIERNADIYSLPSTDSQKSKITLPPGESVKIEDSMGDWVLIRDDKTNGWIKHSAIEKIWPY